MGANFNCIELEIYADDELEELSKAFSTHFEPNWCGENGSARPGAYFYSASYSYHFADEASNRPSKSTVDQRANDLCDIILSLPTQARNLWDNAIERVFDVGLEANTSTKMEETIIDFLSPETMAKLAKVNARLAVSVYSHDLIDEQSTDS